MAAQHRRSGRMPLRQAAAAVSQGQADRPRIRVEAAGQVAPRLQAPSKPQAKAAMKRSQQRLIALSFLAVAIVFLGMVPRKSPLAARLRTVRLLLATAAAVAAQVTLLALVLLRLVGLVRLEL